MNVHMKAETVAIPYSKINLVKNGVVKVAGRMQNIMMHAKVLLPDANSKVVQRVLA